MQGDYFSKMQQQQAGAMTPNEVTTGPNQPMSPMGPGAGMQQAPMPNISPEEIMDAQGGEDVSKPEQKERLMSLLEQAGILEDLSNEDMKEINMQIENALTALEQGNIEAFQNNPIIQLVGSLVGGAAEMSQMNEGQGPSEQQMQQMQMEAEQADAQTAPDMATMAGGQSGR
jgi:hypothetical protein